MCLWSKKGKPDGLRPPAVLTHNSVLLSKCSLQCLAERTQSGLAEMGTQGDWQRCPVSHLETLHRKAATSLGLEGSRIYVGREVGKAFPAEETGQGMRERAAESGKMDEGQGTLQTVQGGESHNLTYVFT